MCFNRFFRTSCCNCCCSRCPAGGNSAQVYTLYSLHRFVDVPMQTYYGTGYSQQEALESIDQSLAEMATIQAGMQSRCNCNRCC